MPYPFYHNKPSIRKRILWWRLWRKHAKKCKGCGSIYMPYPYYQKVFPQSPHYPNETYCGFCVYDMDSRKHSEEEHLFYQEECGYYENRYEA